MTTKNLTAEEFENFISSQEPVVVDFYADWCAPCKAMVPVLEKASVQHPGKIAKINVDQSPEISAKFGIRSIPTMLVFKNNQVIGKRVGAVSKVEEISSMIDLDL